jgi:hypothetical protein
MTGSAFASHSSTTTLAHRPLLDVLVERLARRLLAWSDRRVVKHQLTHERVALLIALERGAHRGGSSIGGSGRAPILPPQPH